MTSLAEDARSQQRTARDRDWQAGENHELIIRIDIVCNRIAALRFSAQPGPSKLRNGFLAAITLAVL